MADVKKGYAVLDHGIESRPSVVGPLSFGAQLRDLWERGLPGGDKTGWPSIDRFYSVVPGQLTIVTGWPGSGKSEWLDALLINLSRQGWKFAIFSPENQPVVVHLTKLLEKMSGKPFGAGPTARMTADEVGEYADELEQSFGFLEQKEGALAVKDVMEAAIPFFGKFPNDTKRGLVIDPWNELEHWRPGHLSETEYVSMTLSAVRHWAREHKVHVWIVAHPQKMRREDGKLPIPRPDMIAGSQHWWNKADCALTVWRDMDNIDSQEIEIHVQKVRFKHVGRPGLVSLNYDRVTGRYHEPKPMISSVGKSFRRMKDAE